jgi:hypothetical protein
MKRLWASRRYRSEFDPIAIEEQLVATGTLHADDHGPSQHLGDDERFFTEGDERLYALWRISLARQLQPRLLRALERSDLLFLAGQNPDGYAHNPAEGIDTWANKVSQNAERARIELDRRARLAGLRHSLLVGVVGALVGAVLALGVSSIRDEGDETPTRTTTTSRATTP